MGPDRNVRPNQFPRGLTEQRLAVDDLNELLSQRLQPRADKEMAGGRRMPGAVTAEERLAKFLELPSRSAVDLHRISESGPRRPAL